MNSAKTEMSPVQATVVGELAEHELLSALADGELRGAELAAAMDLCAEERSQSTWELYHLVGDVLRSPDLAQPGSREFLNRFRQQLADEPTPVAAPVAQDVQSVVAGAGFNDAANASVFRWKMVAGFASLAAVAAVGWSALSGIQAPGPGPAGAAQQLAGVGARPSATAEPAAPVVAVADADGQHVMIRDPRLDELLAAHRQFGSTSALQMPAGFLRNANFDAPDR